MQIQFYKSSFLNIAFLIAISIFIFTFGIGEYGLLDKDEPRYAGCALEMIENNDYIIPKFNFQDRFDKPVLFYWLIAALYKAFGVSDFTSRLPSALCAVLLILFTYFFVKTIKGKLQGLVSALLLCTSIEFILLGRRAATDIALCLFFSGTLYSIFLSYFVKEIKYKVCWLIISGLFMGLSVLTKGPVGVVLPFLVLLIFQIVRKQFDMKHLRIYFSILFIALFVSLPWYLKVHFATSGEFTKEFFFEHNVNRFTSVVGEHPGPVWFYIPIVLGGFMPWTLICIHGTYFYIKNVFRKPQAKLLQFLFVWIITIFLFFSLSKTKLATYILLIFPALSIITGCWICILGKKKLSVLKKLVSSSSLLFLPAVVFAFYLILNWKIETVEKNAVLFKLIICFFLLLSGVLISIIFSRKYYISVLIYSIGFAVPLVLGINAYLVPYYKHTHADLREFAILAKKLKGKEMISFGMYRPSLVYYSRMPVDFNSKKEQIKKIKEKIRDKENVFIVGHSSDVKKHKKLFEKVKIIKVKEKYFIASLSI